MNEDRNIFDIIRRDLINEAEENNHYDDDDDLNESIGSSDSDEPDHLSEEDASDSDDEDYVNDARRENLELADFIAGDGTKWHHQRGQLAQPRQHNILRRPQGLTQLSHQANNTVLDIFQLFLTDDIIDQIIQHTNREAERVHREHPEIDLEWRPLDIVELKAFIGLILYAGSCRSSRENYEDMWNPIHGKPMYKAMMSLKRFKSILRFIRFDNKRTRQEHRLLDKAAPLRELFEMIVVRWKLFFVPGNNITVDEQLVKFRENCPFRQYMPKKLGKYGIKLWLASDSTTGYCLVGSIYTGRPIDGPRQANLGETSVIFLAEKLDNNVLHGRNFVTDRFFTCKSLADRLLTKNVTLLGTVGSHRTFVPRYITQPREQGSAIYCYSEDKTLLLYQQKADAKPVLILSTMHHNPGNANNLPEMIDDYNHHKCGVDLTDMMCSCYSTRHKSRRWPLVLFCGLLEIMAINAFIIWCTKNFIPGQRLKRRHFLQDLALDLAAPHMRRRLAIQQTTKVAKKCIHLVLQLDVPQVAQRLQ